MKYSVKIKISRAFAWIRKHVSQRNFIIFSSVVVGMASGVAAVILRETVHFIQHFLTEETYQENFLQFFYPIVGITVSVVLTRLMTSESAGHAITDILYSIAKKSSQIARYNMFSRLITSPFTVGFGGSAGLESPIVMTGAALGANIGNAFHLNYKIRTMMIGCGTAGVISAIFNAPIAGLIFSLEVILVNVSLGNIIPLLISSVTASIISYTLAGNSILFSYTPDSAFQASDTHWYIFLGMFSGFFATYFNFIVHWVEGKLTKIKGFVVQAIVASTLLSILILLFPPVFGEGYAMIRALLDGQPDAFVARSFILGGYHPEWLIVIFMFLVIFVKAFATGLTIGGGGSGGTFAPSLFVGGTFGYLFAAFLNITGVANLSTANFVMVGMCGALSGIQYAPLTAIFLIAELTGGYSLFVPLMIVSAISYSTVTYFNMYSVYTRELVARGDLAIGDDDASVLNKLKLDSLVETDIRQISPDAKLKDMIKLISKSTRNIFAVTDEENKLVGIITLDNVREIMFDEQKQQTVYVSELMERPPAQVEVGEKMTDVMHKFETTQAWNLPVVESGRYCGFISKSRIFGGYRKKLMESLT